MQQLDVHAHTGRARKKINQSLLSGSYDTEKKNVKKREST